MPCQTCGGQRQQPRPDLNTAPPPDQNGLVTLEFIGVQTAPIKFKVSDENGQAVYYRGANDGANKYIQVVPHHARQLLERGAWRVVVKPSKANTLPPTQDFESWRRKNQEQNERARALAEQSVAYAQTQTQTETKNVG